jgi:Tol biopolymer transport system component
VVASDALLTLPGSSGSWGASRPGRVLWQPRRDALLYSSASSGGVALVLKDLGGGARTVATVPAVLDAAFSPDGSRLLVRTPQEFSVWNVGQPGAAVYSWSEADPAAVASWSPDGRFVLIDDTSGSQLATIAARKVTSLLASASVANPHAAQPPFFWHPATGSPWSPDGTRIVFAAARGDTWHGAALPSGAGSQSGGLYVGAISGDGTPGAVTLIDPSDDRAPSWGYADPSTSFLLPS